MRKDWAGLLDRVLGRRLRRLVKRYQKAHPETVCHSWSHTLGEATIYQGYTVGAEFQLQAGTLELVVELAYLDRHPGFEEARVGWREPGFEHEYGWPPKIWVGTWEENWRQRSLPRLRKGLPRLVSHLKQALRRGHPPRDRDRTQSAPVPLQVLVQASEREIYETIHSRLSGIVMATAQPLEIDFIRCRQAQARGWSLPDDLPQEPARIEGLPTVPDLEQAGRDPAWRQLYRRQPRCRGALSLSRVAFAGQDEAYLRVHRRIGYGDSHSRMRPQSWDGQSPSQPERWDAPLAAELCELVRLVRSASGWKVSDAIDLRAPVSRELMEAAVRDRLQEALHAVTIPATSQLAAVVLANIQLDRWGDFVEAHAQSCQVDAVLKDGHIHRFTIHTLSMFDSQPCGPIERLIVLNGLNPVHLVEAIRSWLNEVPNG